MNTLSMASNNKITYIGHATLLLDIDGIHLLTDPVLKNWIFHLHRQSMSVKIEHCQSIDAVLISHLHLDHFNIPSLKKIGMDILLLVPMGSASILHKKGFSRIVEMRPGDSIQVGEVTITATYAEHHGSRPPFGPHTGCLGYLIQGTHAIYFPGDTDIFPGMTNLAENLDVALLPVWGWGPNLGPGHMNPHRAAEALTLLRPRIAIPIHWGTFYPAFLGWVRSQLLIEPPHLFKQYASKIKPDVVVKILSPGSTYEIS